MKISAKLAFLAIVSTLAYLGLAVWGLGGFSAFFSHAPLVVIVFATLVMAIASLFTEVCLLYTSPSPRDGLLSRMPSSA